MSSIHDHGCQSRDGFIEENIIMGWTECENKATKLSDIQQHPVVPYKIKGCWISPGVGDPDLRR
jgi:hypothetical protein